MKPAKAEKRPGADQCERNCLSVARPCMQKSFVYTVYCLHGWGGCDTTSAAFGQGKTAVMKLVEQNSTFIQNICSISNDPFATKEQVSTAGVQLATRTYGN